MLEELKEQVLNANLELKRESLVIYSWGNVSGIDRDKGIIAIKPSGVPYDELKVENIVLLDLNGKKVEGDLNPSSDTATHLELYKQFKEIGGVCHTHSTNATMWAQAGKEIPCMGTTHADYFYGPVPITNVMSNDLIQSNYECNTGKVIIDRFKDLDPMKTPAVLVANHGPFTWDQTAARAVENAVVLEEVAKMAMGTFAINPEQSAISKSLLDKHFFRKHGSTSYYGQN